MKKQGVVGIAALVALLAVSVPAQVRAQRQGGFGGGRRMGGMAMGTVSQIDAGKHAIQVQMGGPNGQGQGQGQAQWVVLTDQTTISRQTQGTLADLKPNDNIVVSGTPTSINATQLQVGEIAQQPFGGFRGGPGGAQGDQAAPPGAPGGGQGAAPGGPGGGPGGPGGGRGAQAPARVTGFIVSTNPLVIALPGNIKVTVNADRSTPVTKTVKSAFTDIKQGDTVMAFGQPDDNGVITAMTVNVGVDLNAGFRGGFGGGGGGRPQRGGQGGGQGQAQGRAQETF